jgi:hypothetical protein
VADTPIQSLLPLDEPTAEKARWTSVSVQISRTWRNVWLESVMRSKPAIDLPMCTENPIRVDDVMESPKLAG